MADEVGPLQRHVKEEPQRRDSGVDARNADPLLRHMHLEATNVLTRRAIRRPSEESGKAPEVADVILLHFLLEPARRHVLDHALAQWADGLVEHRENSCLAWGYDPMI